MRHDASADKNFQLNQVDLREAKYLPADFSFRATMNIYGSKIAFFALKEDELFSVIIDSAVLANMLEQFFGFAWEMAK